jgi:predicted DNA-binding transcriptional regulator AlpA
MANNLPPLRSAAPLQPGDLVDEHEAAGILGLRVSTIRNWRAEGRGPRFRKIGLRAVRYLRADLESFVAGSAGKAAA